MKHRGTARKRLLPVATDDGSDLPGGDISVTVDGRALGEIVSRNGARGFALIRLDKLDEAGGASLQAGEKGVRLAKPVWLFP
jgi:folate-binding Fe-S cluster repair protein YgfZ